MGASIVSYKLQAEYQGEIRGVVGEHRRGARSATCTPNSADHFTQPEQSRKKMEKPCLHRWARWHVTRRVI
jgi:hypothetical protein